MSRKWFRSGFPFGVLLLVGLSLSMLAADGPAATAAPVQPSTTTQSVPKGNISTKEAPGWTLASRAWSKERMSGAKPMVFRAPAGDNIDISPAGPDGKPGYFPSVLPLDVQGPTIEGADLAVLSPASPLGYSYPAPFTGYENFSAYTVFPYIAVGKLFFTQFGIDYVCSATSIGNYAIWTAGHCLHAGNNSGSGWSSDVAFVPAYLDGSTPKGQWLGHRLWTTSNWYSSRDLRYDMGGVILDVSSSGDKISEVVGNLGFSYNQVRELNWFLMGYPAESPFTGGRQRICATSYAYNYTGLGAPYPSGVGCDMTGGSSGGPWIHKFSGAAGNTNYLNGENSFGRIGYPNEMFSPYFGDAAYSLWLDLLNDSPFEDINYRLWLAPLYNDQ